MEASRERGKRGKRRREQAKTLMRGEPARMKGKDMKGKERKTHEEKMR